jgi:antitoxin HigA-1
MAKKLKPMHPGEVLREEFLVPLKLSAGALAKVCGLPRTRIERIASEQSGITADTALRLAKALGTTAQLWLNLQNDHDIGIAKRDLGKLLDRPKGILVISMGSTGAPSEEERFPLKTVPIPNGVRY